MSQKSSKSTILGVAIVVVVAAIGFGIYAAVSKSDTSVDKTSLRLKWINQAQFSGYYMAKKEGLYSKAGLDVTIDPAGPNISPIQV